MLTFVLLIQQVIYGITMGTTYALVGLGFTMIYRSLSLVNFAHGTLAMMGAFFALTFYVGYGLPYYISFILSTLLVGLIGMVLEKTIYNSLQNRSLTELMIAFVAVSIILRQSAILVWGAEGLFFPSVFGDSPFTLCGVTFVPQDLVTVLFAVILMLILLLFFRTRIGMSMQAISQDKVAAQIMGINVPMMNTLTFGLSSALGACAGILFAPLAVVHFNMGEMFLIKGFTAAILGGLGNIAGAVLGGFLFGIIERVTSVAISSLYLDSISFGILILVLIFKPNGLLAKKTAIKV